MTENGNQSFRKVTPLGIISGAGSSWPRSSVCCSCNNGQVPLRRHDSSLSSAGLMIPCISTVPHASRTMEEQDTETHTSMLGRGQPAMYTLPSRLLKSHAQNRQSSKRKHKYTHIPGNPIGSSISRTLRLAHSSRTKKSCPQERVESQVESSKLESSYRQ